MNFLSYKKPIYCITPHLCQDCVISIVEEEFTDFGDGCCLSAPRSDQQSLHVFGSQRHAQEQEALVKEECKSQGWCYLAHNRVKKDWPHG